MPILRAMVHALHDDTSPSTVRFLSPVGLAVSNYSERPCIATKAKVLKAFAKKFPLTLGPGLKLVEVIGDPMDGTFAVNRPGDLVAVAIIPLQFGLFAEQPLPHN